MQETRKFRLSHTCPVDPPLEIAASLDATFLNRHEVIAARRNLQCSVNRSRVGLPLGRGAWMNVEGEGTW